MTLGTQVTPILNSHCGEKGIRTLDTLSDIQPFQGCPFDRSGISPYTKYYHDPLLPPPPEEPPPKPPKPPEDPPPEPPKNIVSRPFPFPPPHFDSI